MVCEEVGYTEFNTQLTERLSGQRLPLSVTVGLTDRCNLRCVHCFVHDPPQDKLLRPKELTSPQWFRIFDEMADAGDHMDADDGWRDPDALRLR